MKIIQPLFPDQQSITEALNKLSLEDRKSYDQLMLEYKELISTEHPDHKKIAELISEAQKLLLNSLPK